MNSDKKEKDSEIKDQEGSRENDEAIDMGLGDDLRELVGVDSNAINANVGINDITLNQTIDSKKNGS